MKFQADRVHKDQVEELNEDAELILVLHVPPSMLYTVLNLCGAIVVMCRVAKYTM